MERFTTQKVIIPKGAVDPRETTVIEIPSHLHSCDKIIALPSTRRHKWPEMYGAPSQKPLEYQNYETAPLNGSNEEVEMTNMKRPKTAHDPRSPSYIDRDEGEQKHPKSTKQQLLLMLENLETSEVKKIQQDLHDIQTARRRLIMHASTLKTPTEVLNNYLDME